MSLILDSEEVAKLTGRKQAKRQLAWLSENGWKFEIGGDGLPKIARAYFDERMAVPKPKRKGPRLEGLESAHGT